MTGISIASKREWKAILDRFQMNVGCCIKYPFGEYFTTEINGENVLFIGVALEKLTVLQLHNI